MLHVAVIRWRRSMMSILPLRSSAHKINSPIHSHALFSPCGQAALLSGRITSDYVAQKSLWTLQCEMSDPRLLRAVIEFLNSNDRPDDELKYNAALIPARAIP